MNDKGRYRAARAAKKRASAKLSPNQLITERPPAHFSSPAFSRSQLLAVFLQYFLALQGALNSTQYHHPILSTSIYNIAPWCYIDAKLGFGLFWNIVNVVFTCKRPRGREDRITNPGGQPMIMCASQSYIF